MSGFTKDQINAAALELYGVSATYDPAQVERALSAAAATPTPPADDLREALAMAIRKGSGASKYQSELLAKQMLPHLAQLEVRPRATVTDPFAEYVDHLGVDANEEHDSDWWEGYRQAQRDNVRQAAAALEAARGAHS